MSSSFEQQLHQVRVMAGTTFSAKAQQIMKEGIEIVQASLEQQPPLTVGDVVPFFDLPDDEKSELKAMAYLSDDTLWTIAREQMPLSIQERMSVLMSRNTRGTITDAEYSELTELVERGNKLTLRKAKAMNYLMDRGYSVAFDNLEPRNE